MTAEQSGADVKRGTLRVVAVGDRVVVTGTTPTGSFGFEIPETGLLLLLEDSVRALAQLKRK